MSDLREYGNVNMHSQRLYYVGTTALRAGQPLAYVLPSGAPDIDDADLDNRVGLVVDAIDGSNVGDTFAGIVSPSSVGVSGPQWIDVMKPQRGDFVEVEVTNLAAIVAETSYMTLDLGLASNTPAYATDGAPSATDSTIMLAMETVAINPSLPGTDDTRSTILAYCVR